MMAKASKESKLRRCMKAPIRILTKARDFYIQSITECGGRASYGAGMGCPIPHVNGTLPKSFSVNSSRSSSNDDDFRELVRAASTRSLGNKVQVELLRRQVSKPARLSPTAGVNVVPRSQSVAIGRIDEDKTCDFEEDVKVQPGIYSRSRSYAVSKKSGIF